jgi:hypothetical protein
MRKCKFCGGSLKENVKKCTTCGELCGLRGWVLRYVPLTSVTSVIVALGSLYIAYREIQATGQATVRAEAAQSEARLAVSQLHVKEKAADRAIRDLARKLPESSRDDILKDLRLPPRTTLEQLEEQAKRAPENSDLQRRLFLFRELKRPD